MAEKPQIIEALRSVQDPELRQSIVDLGMVHDVQVDDGVVSFTLALTTLACPLREQIAEDARQALLRLDGIQAVDVRLREMTQEEKKRIWPDTAREQQTGVAEHLNHIQHVVAVMSGKGGVGKSSVAALLAVALRRQGKRVGVLDADITGPSIPKMFGLREPPPMGPVGIIPAETGTGIRIMSINLLLPAEDEAVIWRGPLISGAIKQFWGDVVWGDLDYLIVDLPPGTSDASLTVMQSMPLNGVVLVTSPQGLAGMVVRKAARMAEQLNVSVVGVVENMSYAVCPECGEHIEIFGPSQAQSVAEYVNAPLLGRLPLDPELARRCDAGEIEAYPAAAFESVARAVEERVPETATEPLFSLQQMRATAPRGQ
ncbi:MAG: Mrp/NBP35 family ATP-binding protein [Anaerolineae bacterium]|jgi:Mrp family chromosome partitioning ATPase